jgi:three-Cys-motif partner protein
MWDIQSQTKIKLSVLRNYLAAWATVLKHRERLLYYVDGFAGPGWYNDPKTGNKVAGSPAQVAQLYLDHRKRRGWQYELRLINVESDKTHFKELVKESLRFQNDVIIENIQGEFLDHLYQILTKIGEYHTFFFIDPFGISGIKFTEMETVFKRPNTEVLLNFNYDGLQRCLGELANLNHPDSKRRKKAINTIDRVCKMLNATPRELKEIVEASRIPKEKKVFLLKKYRDSLWKYKTLVYPLPVNYPGQERTFYYLIFMTENIIALKIMKDVMKKAKKMEKGEQLFLPIPEIDVDALRKRLFELYAGKVIAVKEIYKDWLPKVSIIDGEDYLARDIDKALNSMAKDPDMSVTKDTGDAPWNPIYRFSR